MTYIGLTIGPIIKTLSMAKKTREIWTASYLFSFLMKTIIKKLLEKGIDKNQIIVPNADSITEIGIKSSAGLYPDRLIFESTPGDFEKLAEAVDETMNEIAQGIADKIQIPESTVRRDLDNYLQIYFLEKKLEAEENPILKLSSFLDAMERHAKYIHHDTDQILPKFLKLNKKDFLSKAAGLERFESLIEIATRELSHQNEKVYNKTVKHYLFDNNEEEDDSTIIQALKSAEEFKKEFKTYHKYIAIVQADGDNIGDTIKAIGSDLTKLKRFSKDLTAFARQAVSLIEQYGGAPVYAGGDDLLFFAPLVNPSTNAQNIFGLIDSLDTEFKKNFPEASLSYGISITYYKFPMNEAIEEAHSQLFQKAKSYKYKYKEKDKEKEKEKNAVAFKILKHSGRSFGTIFNKDNEIYSLFKQMLAQYSVKEKYLNSIVETLQTNRGVFKVLFEQVKDEAETRIANFFDNSFDEDVHHKNRKYIDDTAALIYKVYNSPHGADSSEKEDESKFQAVYTILRTLHFFNQNDNEFNQDDNDEE